MKKKTKKSGIVKEFKQFISKGSVVDLSVGVIIGGAFTAIVTALTTHIFQPIINAIISLVVGEEGFESAVTILRPVYDDAHELVLEKSIYINWGAFISAVINFFLVAIILFAIVKIINTASKKAEAIKAAELEKYYEKHPEERPQPKDPVKPQPTELDVLNEIKDILKNKQ